MFLVFDTETTGLPKQYNAPLTDFDNWPRLVQLAWQLHDDKGQLAEILGIEYVKINKQTNTFDFKQQLRNNEVYFMLNKALK